MASHHHSHTHTQHHQKRLLAITCVTTTIMVSEIVGASISGSLSLWADAGHMLTDVLALCIAFAATLLSNKPANHHKTYGYRRLEVLAAFINGITLLIIAGSIAYEAIARLYTPNIASVHVQTLINTAIFGLLANILSLCLLGHHHSNINLRAAFLHVLGDTLSSLSVLTGGILMFYTGWTHIDSLISICIAALIVLSSIKLLRDVTYVLLEAAPADMDAHAITQHLLNLPGVASVHAVHVWSITTDCIALSAHIVAHNGDTAYGPLRNSAYQALAQAYGAHKLEYITLQIETVQDGCRMLKNH